MKFRPVNDPRNTHLGDPNPGSPVEWEDNFASNLLAWASYRVTPNWCQDEEHWTSRMVQALWTDCPCCMFFRGVVVGLLPMLLLQIIILFVAIVMLAGR